MQYKKLTEEDITVGYNPIIGNQFELTSSVNVDYSTGVGEKDSSEEAKNFRYRQFANIIQGDATSNLPIGNSFFYYALNRKTFKNSIHAPSFRYAGSSLNTEPGDRGTSEAGVVYTNNTRDVFLYPEIGLVLVSSANTNIIANSEEINTTSHVYIRARSTEFNYSTNPSFSDFNDKIRFIEWVYNPVVYITTIGLYNDNGDLLAIAKVPKPIKKTFHDEVLIQIQLDY